MHGKKRNLTILLLLLSPLIIGTIIGQLQQEGSVFGLVVILAAVFGIPAIGIIGLTISAAVRNSPSAEKHSFYGYAIPAGLVCLYPIIAGISGM